MIVLPNFLPFPAQSKVQGNSSLNRTNDLKNHSLHTKIPWTE